MTRTERRIWIGLILVLFLADIGFNAGKLMLLREKLDRFLLMGSDPMGYYQFLPGVFVQHDLTALPWAHQLPDGHKLSVFTIGVALLQLPFFLLGHGLAWLVGAPPTGYSWPYALGQMLGTATCSAAGLALLFTMLKKVRGPRTAWISVGVLLLGTNLFYYTVAEPGMSHAYSFFLFAWLLWITVRMESDADGRWVIPLFVCSALIVLVRPLNAVALLLPILWRARSMADLGRLPRALLRHPRQAVAGAALAMALLFLQSWYWHATAGQWVLFTYGRMGQGFDWSAPHLLDILISHQNGWFVYEPLMVPVLIALAFLLVRRGPGLGRAEAAPIMLVWAITWYCYASWWAWWLGGAYGFRGFVEVSAWFALPLAWLVDRIARAARGVRIPVVCITAFLIVLNLRMSFIYRSPWDGPGWTWASVVAAWKEALWL